MKIKLMFLIISVLFESCGERNMKKYTVYESPAAENNSVINTGSGDKNIGVAFPQLAAETITVGGQDADVSGFSSAAIQTAIDALKARGSGGTIKLGSGTFNVTAPVKLYSNMWLQGSGERTILKKCKGYRSLFAIDADYGELQVTVKDPSGFEPGMGVAIYDDTQRSAWDLTTVRITRIEGNTLYLNDYLLRDYYMDKNGVVSNACSVIEAIGAENVRISDLTVDGSKETNDWIDGCRAGGIYLHRIAFALVENVVVKNFSSDGISWQTTEHVTVRNSEITGCTNSGLHPGTGSPYSLIEGNNSHHNEGYGLFVCWRVRNGIVRNNRLHDNGRNGISTGHKDTDMLFANNHIYMNGMDGITLRGEKESNAPHGTIIRDNIIENNGIADKAYGISINSPARNVVVEGNIFRNSSPSQQTAAVYVTENGVKPELKGNDITELEEGELIVEKGTKVN